MATSMDRTEGSLTRRDTGLVWGLKDSFLAYVAGCLDACIELSPGSGQLPDGSFYFSPDPSARPRSLWFRGGFRIRAHGGLLDVCLANPRVENRSGGHILTGETWKEGLWQRVRFADVLWTNDAPQPMGAPEQGPAAEDGMVCASVAETRLHPDATELFDDTYAAGEILSPLVVRTLQASR